MIEIQIHPKYPTSIDTCNNRMLLRPQHDKCNIVKDLNFRSPVTNLFLNTMDKILSSKISILVHLSQIFSFIDIGELFQIRKAWRQQQKREQPIQRHQPWRHQNHQQVLPLLVQIQQQVFPLLVQRRWRQLHMVLLPSRSHRHR